MKFGIFYEQQLPKPWHDGGEQQLFAEALDQVELADRLGFDHLWVAEHHFLPEYSHSSAPEMFLAAASQRTKRIRLGHGIIQATTNQAPRIAERIATLDVLSGGRAEFGLGEGQGMMELEPFGVSMDDKRERFEEMVAAVLPMLYHDTWSYEGKYVSFPERSVLPRPVQKPHPPLWVACTKVKTIRDAARWGFGALGFQFATPERADVWVRAYYNEFLHRQSPLAGYAVNPQIAVASYFMCAPSDEEARARADGNTFFEWSLGQYSRKLMAPGNESLWERYQAWRQTDAGRENGGATKGLVGSPGLAVCDARRHAGIPYRPGHPVDAGGQDGPRGRLRLPGALRFRGHAPFPRRRDRTPAMETGGPRRSDPPGGPVRRGPRRGR